MRALRLLQAASLAALAFGASAAHAADTCPNRGDLDQMYCDANKDLVADTPTDPAKLKTPSTLVFTYTPVEDPAVYEDIFKPFTKHLSECTGKRVVFYQVQSNAAEIEAMRSGRLHAVSYTHLPKPPFRRASKNLMGGGLTMSNVRNSTNASVCDSQPAGVSHSTSQNATLSSHTIPT